MKTIIQFIDSLGDGGASALIKDYALCLKNDGYRVVVLLWHPRPESVHWQQINKAGIECKYIFPQKNLAYLIKMHLFGKRIISRYLVELCQEIKPVAIHVHLRLLKYILPASNYLKRGG